MDMIPIEIPAPLHDELNRMASLRGRSMQEMVRKFLADGLCREQDWLQQQHLLVECYQVMAQDNQVEGQGFLSLQDEAMG
jgi:hypothetical protein